MGRRLSDRETGMMCMDCQGKMERGTAPFHIDRRGYHLILDTLSAWVCIQCSESYFAEVAGEAIQQVIRVVDTHTSTLLLSA
jgi:YgiT-type zinc finger domain-containing protein